MSQRDWQSTDNPQRMTDLFQQADRIAHDINKRCTSVQLLVESDISHLASDISAYCAGAGSVQQVKQLLSGGRLTCSLGSILSRLLPASVSYDVPKYTQCAYDVSKTLIKILELYSISKGTPNNQRQALAKQLQQAELIEPLTNALGALTLALERRSASMARVIGPDSVSKSSEPGSMQLFQETAIYLLQELVGLAKQISSLCPVGPYSSSKAQSLMPAAAQALADLAQLSSKLCKDKMSGHAVQQIAHKMMSVAVLQANEIMTAHLRAVRDLPESDQYSHSSHESWYLRKTPHFRQLQLFMFAIQAQLWLQPVGHRTHQLSLPQQQSAALQKLWAALGYLPEQLPGAATMLGICHQAIMGQDPSPFAAAHSSPATYKPSDLMKELSICWGFLAARDPDAVAADQPKPSCQQLQDEAQQAVLVLKVAQDLFHQGKPGVQADIPYLVAAASWFNQYFISASKMYIHLSQKQSPPLAVIPMSDMVKLLLQYLQHGKAVVQLQQATAASSSGSSSSSSSAARDYGNLQHAVLGAIANMTGPTGYGSVASRLDPGLQELWMLHSQQITIAVEESLRNTAVAAAADGMAFFKLHEMLGPCVDDWVRMVTICRAQDEAVKLVEDGHHAAHMRSAFAAAAAAGGESGPSDAGKGHHSAAALSSSYWQQLSQLAGSADVAGGCIVHQADSIIWESMTEHISRTTAAGSTNSPVEIKVGDQAGAHPMQHTSSQYSPHPMELQVLSLMTSFCKAMMQTMELGLPGVPLQLLRTQMHADYLAFRAAVVVKHQAGQQQSLLHPAVRPWLSLLGRCLVMIGQRLKVLHAEEKIKYQLVVQEMMIEAGLNSMQQQLTRLQTSPEAKDLKEQVKELERSAQQCSDAAKLFQKQLTSKQLSPSQQQEYTNRLNKLRDACRARDAAVAKLQEANRQQLQLQQQIRKAKAQLHLCTHLITRTPTIITANLKNSMTSLIGIGRVLSQCWSHTAQQQSQQGSDSNCPSSNTADASAAEALNARLGAIMQQLLTKLLPTLVTMEGACGLLPDDRPDARTPVLSRRSSCSAVDVLVKDFEQVVTQGCGMKWLQDHSNDQAVQSAFQAATPAAADLIRELLGKHADSKKLDDRCLYQLQSGLLSSGLYQQLHEQLVAIGSELITALPHCWCCNNPGCGNLSAESELQLVGSGNKEQVCAGCTGGSRDKEIRVTAARYCSVECQRQHWKQHKKVCRKLHKQHKQ